jgi:hypothetical protein
LTIPRQWELKTDDDRDSTYLHALQEATLPALGSTALLERTRSGLSPSDVALLERQPAAVPEEMWMAAVRIAAGDPAQAESVALQAALAGQFQIAERLWTPLIDRDPRAVFNLGLMRRLWPVRRLPRELQAYMRKARDEPHKLVQTAGSMMGEVVGRDVLCHVLIEDLRDPAVRRPHVVIGGTGTGKTAVLVRLTQLLAGLGAVPVPIRLRDAQERLDFRELARERFVTEIKLVSDAEGEKVWRELCRNDQVVVLADGLEEALVEGDVQDERDNLIRLAIRRANEQWLPLVITSRPHDSLGDMEAAVVELEPLSEEAPLEYVQRLETGEDSRRLAWIVETADVAETPLYLQITHQLQRAGLFEYMTPRRNDRRLDTRSVDREELRLLLLQTWMQGLIGGHSRPEVPLGHDDRQATVEQLSLLACVGLQRDGPQVRFDQAEALRTDPPPAIIAEVDQRLGRLKRGHDLRLAAAWGAQLGLVELLGDGVRFPHSIMQAYLASRLIHVAMADSAFRDQVLAKSGREFLIALVMHSRARLQTPGSYSTANGSSLAAQHSAAERTSRELLCEEASRRTDVKALHLYAAALQIDSVENQPAHGDIAEKLRERWPGIRARDPRTLAEAKLNAVRRCGETARTISERRRRGEECPAEPGYLQLYRIGCFESSYLIRLACAQEIGAGGDEAFDALATAIGPPAADRSNGHATAGPGRRRATVGALPPEAGNLSPNEDLEREERAWNERVIRAWLAPLLVGSVTERSTGANKNLQRWLQYLRERAHNRAESDLRFSLEVALAQGFKHAANRRSPPAAGGRARMYLAEEALEMLKGTGFWFTQLTLIQALCLLNMSDSPKGRSDKHGASPDAIVWHWLELAGRKQADRRQRRGSPPARIPSSVWRLTSLSGHSRQAFPSGTAGSTRAAWQPGLDPIRRTREHPAGTTSGFRRLPDGPSSTRKPSSLSLTCCCC